MLKKDKIRVLIIDDSMVFREMLFRNLSEDPCIEVVATAEDPFDARDKILKYEPDVITCDVEMPKMNGVEFIRRLLPQYPLPVVVVSSNEKAIVDAIKAGAIDFVPKPNLGLSGSVEEFIQELRVKIRIASKAQVNISEQKRSWNNQPVKTINGKVSDRLIAIGASTGGTEAIFDILMKLPSDCPGIVIVQHIPPVFSKMFAERLNVQTSLKCKEAENGDYLEKGKVFLAPGDKHMRVRRVGEKFKVEVFEGEKVNGHCPSVDILFESVAKEAGDRAIGVLLTGMGYDGAKGLLNIRRKGAITIGQDEASSVVYGMPKVAYNMGAVEVQSSLENIHKHIITAMKE